MDVLFDTFNATPGVYFLVGLTIGVLLRDFLYSPANKQHSGRYRSAGSASVSKKHAPATKLGIREPSFDWINRNSNKVTEKHASVTLDHPNTKL